MIRFEELDIRSLCDHHLAAVIRIDEGSHDVNALRLKDWLEVRSRDTVQTKVLLNLRGDVLGFVIYELHPACISLLHFAVCEASEPVRHMLACRLVEHILARLRGPQSQRWFVDCFVDERDMPTLTFLRSLGWKGELWADGEGEAGDIIRMFFELTACGDVPQTARK